jgi:hypothetical protein
MRNRKVVWGLIVVGCMAQLVPAQTVGAACNAGETSSNRFIVCERTNYVYHPPYVQNASKGDVLLSSECGGVIGGLLQQVVPPQRFSHSGIMVDNQYTVRHSTASSQRYIDSAGSDGFDPGILKYGWPGTITESIFLAYEGHPMQDPNGKWYSLQSFRNDASEFCLTGTIFPSVVKPPVTDEDSVRLKLESIADAAQTIQGHYRFYAYSSANIVGDQSLYPPASVTWAAQNREPTVCSSLVWNAAHRAQVQVEDQTVESGDRQHSSNPSQLGLSVYTAEERREAGQWLYDYIYNKVYEVAGDWGRFWTDAPDDAGNQIVNCFGFDWCGSEPDKAYRGEEDAKDSDRWHESPGNGIAVSPDDITTWDLPPAGVYGVTETMVYQPGWWEPTYRWVEHTCEQCSTNFNSCRSSAHTAAARLRCLRSFESCTGQWCNASGPAGPRRPSRETCLDDCSTLRELCLDGVGRPGQPTPQRCSQDYNRCRGRCPSQ